MVRKYVTKEAKKFIKPTFEKRFRELLPEDYDLLIDTITTPMRKSFRINLRKCKNTKNLVSNLQNKGLCITPIPFVECGFFVEYGSAKRLDLGNLYEHFLGKIYIQEATSMIPATLCEIPKVVSPDFRVLDMCAAPGSKATQLAEFLGGKGVIVANEVDYRRLGPLKINLERLGVTNCVITCLDGRRISGEELYDRILLDVPCSGTGVIRKSPSTLKTYNPKRLYGIQKLQLQLLDRAFSLLREGGILIYSTCSLEVEENEFCVMKFLEDRGNCEILKCGVKSLVTSNPVKEFRGVEIPRIVYENVLRIWPFDNDTNGFFVAKFRKVSN